jgi:hypothetical protein
MRVYVAAAYHRVACPCESLVAHEGPEARFWHVMVFAAMHNSAQEGQMSICLRRREFVAGLGGAAVWPIASTRREFRRRWKPRRLRPWEGRFADPNERLPHMAARQRVAHSDGGASATSPRDLMCICLCRLLLSIPPSLLVSNGGPIRL